MRRLRVAILGQGRSGWSIHGSNFLKQRNMFEVKAIVEPLQERLDLVDERYGPGIDKYTDYRMLLDREDIDLVVNSTPSHLHTPVNLELLKNGFDVLCEKPLAKHIAEVDALLKAAKENKSNFYVFQQSRYTPVFQEIQRIIASGVLGRIVQISISYSGYSRRWDWQTTQACYGGNLLNTGPHPLDQAVVLYGEGIPEVNCFMDRVNTFGDAEDYCKLVLFGQNKPVIDIEISSCQAYAPFAYNIQASRGGLVADLKKINYKYFLPQECEDQQLTMEPLINSDNNPVYCRETIKWHEREWEGGGEEFGTFAGITGRFYQMLYNHIVNGAELEVTVEQVRKQIAIIEESHRQNQLDTFITLA